MFTIVVDAAGVGQEIPSTGFPGRIGRERLLEGTNDLLQKRLNALDDRNLEIYLKACPVLWSPELEPKDTDEASAYVGRFAELVIDKREARYTFIPYEGFAAISAQRLRDLDDIFHFGKWGWHRTKIVALEEDLFNILGPEAIESQVRVVDNLSARSFLGIKSKRDIPSPTDSVPPEKIFLVHGRDVEAVRDVQFFVYHVTGKMPESLADQPGGGDTIIEKFEREAAASDYAIVLLTPDDEGRIRKGESDMQNRARQNVILELGYFFGKLGRRKVIVLNGGVEQPSDVHGLSYIAYPDMTWKEDMRRELRSAGFDLIN